MSRTTTERNLLMGWIPLRMGWIPRDALIAAMSASVREKDRSIGQILVDQGVLAEDERLLLEALVQKHLAKHGDHAGRSLSALDWMKGSKDDLRAIGDLELVKGLAILTEPDPLPELITQMPHGVTFDLDRFNDPDPGAGPGRPAQRPVARRKTWIAVLGIALAALTVGLTVVGHQRQETERQRRRADHDYVKAADAVEQLLTRIGEDRLRDLPQMESLRAELLDDALQFQLGLLAERSDDPEILLRVTRAARLAANLQVQLNRQEEAERTCSQAISMVDELIARSPRDLRYRRERAVLSDTLGLILARLGRTDEAEVAYREAIDIRGLIVREDPSSAEDRWRMAVGLDQLAVMLQGGGRWEEAEHFFVRGRQLCLANPPSSPADPRVRQQLVTILDHLGRLLVDRGKPTEALQGYTEAVAVQKALIASSPRSGPFRELLVRLLLDQSSALTGSGRPDEAERTLLEARARIDALRTEHPAIAVYQELGASVYTTLAHTIRRDPARASEARETLKSAIAIQEKLVARSPTIPGYLSKLAAMSDSLANLLRSQNAYDEAESLYRKELTYHDRLATEHPRVLAYRYGHGQVLHNLADLLRERGRGDEGLPHEREAVRELATVYESNVRDPHYRMAISYAYWTLCSILLDRKDHRAAAQAVSEYLRIEPNGFEESSEATGFLCRCAQLCRQDSSLPAKERETLAHRYADQAIDALRIAVRNGFRDVKLVETAETYEPIRSRDDFRRIVREVEAMVAD
jgi:tetratricopeptide (TPR) repeat protein